MKRFYVPWLHYLVRRSDVDFAALAARELEWFPRGEHHPVPRP